MTVLRSFTPKARDVFRTIVELQQNEDGGQSPFCAGLAIQDDCMAPVPTDGVSGSQVLNEASALCCGIDAVQAVSYALSNYFITPSAFTGVEISELWQMCHSRFIANSMATLKNNLQEFRDHDLVDDKCVAVSVHQSGSAFCLLLLYDVSMLQ